MKLKNHDLPEFDSISDELIINTLATIVPFETVPYINKLKEILSSIIVVGIKKDSDNYEKATSITKENLLLVPLVNNKLLNNYVRLEVCNFENLYKTKSCQLKVADDRIYPVTFSKKQIAAIKEVISLCDVSPSLSNEVVVAVENKIKIRNSLSRVINWWNNITRAPVLTSCGKIIGYSYASKYSSLKYPPLSEK